MLPSRQTLPYLMHQANESRKNKKSKKAKNVHLSSLRGARTDIIKRAFVLRVFCQLAFEALLHFKIKHPVCVAANSFCTKQSVKSGTVEKQCHTNEHYYRLVGEIYFLLFLHFYFIFIFILL